MSRVCLALVIILTASCVKTPSPFPIYDAIDVSEGMFPVHYEFVDMPAERRIEVSFCNTLRQAVCLKSHNWPGQGGVMDEGSNGMTLIIGQQRFEIEKATPEFCPGCAKYVTPGETLRASIPYESFHLPDTLVNKEKKLEFVPKAYRCRKRS